MSLTEIKSEIEGLPEEERLQLRAYLNETTRSQEQEGVDAARLGQIMREMDSGRKTSRDEILQMHDFLG